MAQSKIRAKIAMKLHFEANLDFQIQVIPKRSWLS